MGLLTKLSPFICSVLVLFFTVSPSFPLAMAASDITRLVYKGCANQNFPDPSGNSSQNLKSLFDSLVSQSSQKGFFSATSGEGQNAIFGLFQCRGDLTNPDCNKCVTKIQTLVSKLCGDVIAARVQLSGCYLRYELSGFPQVSGTQFLFKVCRSDQASGISEFEEKRDSAFQMVENGVKNGTSGLFYTGTYQSLYVLGQCEGDLATSDCGDCIKTADQRAKTECKDSISGQIYLQKCYISYNYYPNGVPGIASSSGSGGSKQHTQRTVAIVLGGFVAFGFLVACLMFVKSLVKKHGGKHGDW